MPETAKRKRERKVAEFLPQAETPAARVEMVKGETYVS
jgi:hypothetical protein